MMAALSDSDSTTRALGWITSVSGWVVGPNTDACPLGFLPAETGDPVGECGGGGAVSARGLRLVDGDGGQTLKVRQYLPGVTIGAIGGAYPLWHRSQHHDWVGADGKNIVVWQRSRGRHEPYNQALDSADFSNKGLYWNDRGGVVPAGGVRGGWVYGGVLYAVIQVGQTLELISATRAQFRAGEWQEGLAIFSLPANQLLQQAFHADPWGSAAISHARGTTAAHGGQVIRVQMAGSGGSFAGESYAFAPYSETVSSEITHSITATTVAPSVCNARWPLREDNDPNQAIFLISGSGIPEYCDCSNTEIPCPFVYAEGIYFPSYSATLSGFYQSATTRAAAGYQIEGADYSRNGAELIATRSAFGATVGTTRDDFTGEALPFYSESGPCYFAGDGYEITYTETGRRGERLTVGAAEWELWGSDTVASVDYALVDLRRSAVLLEIDAGAVTTAKIQTEAGDVPLYSGAGLSAALIPPQPDLAAVFAANDRKGNTLIAYAATTFSGAPRDMVRCAILPVDGGLIANSTILAALGIEGEPGATPAPIRGR